MFQPSSNGHSDPPAVVSADNGKDECLNGSRVTPGGPVGPKDQLDYLVKVLGLTAVYQEFPRKQKDSADATSSTTGDDDPAEDSAEAKEDNEVFTLLSISTEPPQVSDPEYPTVRKQVFIFGSMILAML